MDQLQQLRNLPPRQLATITAAVATVLGTALWCIRDYNDFLALGPGGIPYNVKGWAIATFILRPLALSKSGALRPDGYPKEGAHEEIQDLPKRLGDRASVGGIVPHRQLSQYPPGQMKQKITNLFKNAVTQNSQLVEERISLYEVHNPALFVHKDILAADDSAAPETAHIARGEIGHIHPDV